MTARDSHDGMPADRLIFGVRTLVQVATDCKKKTTISMLHA